MNALILNPSNLKAHSKMGLNNHIILQDAHYICDRVELDRLHGATITVTGSTGLIGTYFLACLKVLSERGVSMRVFALTYSDLPLHTSELIRGSGFEIIQADLADFSTYPRLPPADIIVHSAGYAQPVRFMANPAATLQINTSATIALLKLLRPKGHFLFLSSSEVYCGLKNSLFTETSIGTTTPLHPRAAYIEGKRCGEAICHAFRSQGVHATSARLSDIYGPGTRKHDKRALNSFIEKALFFRKIELLDMGTAMRTYCYVADAVGVLWKVLLHGKEAVYNVGGRSTISIAELAKMIGEITDAPVVFPVTQAQVAGSPEILHSDIARIETEFGTTEHISLEEGLRVTIEWQRELYAQ